MRLYKVSAYIVTTRVEGIIGSAIVFADFLVVAASKKEARNLVQRYVEAEGDELHEFLGVEEITLDSPKVLGLLLK